MMATPSSSCVSHGLLRTYQTPPANQRRPPSLNAIYFLLSKATSSQSLLGNTKVCHRVVEQVAKGDSADQQAFIKKGCTRLIKFELLSQWVCLHSTCVLVSLLVSLLRKIQAHRGWKQAVKDECRTQLSSALSLAGKIQDSGRPGQWFVMWTDWKNTPEGINIPRIYSRKTVSNTWRNI